jgi:putative pyoverdin transport system ATP-binding/permease protein
MCAAKNSRHRWRRAEGTIGWVLCGFSVPDGKPVASNCGNPLSRPSQLSTPSGDALALAIARPRSEFAVYMPSSTSAQSKPIHLLGFLSQVSKPRLIAAIFASALSGVATMGANICIFEYFRAGHTLWWQFALIAPLAIAISRYSRVALGRLAAQSILRLRRQLIRSVIHMPLLEFERFGPTQLLVVFTDDLFRVGSAVRHLATFVASCAFLLAALVYVGWLSPQRMAVAGAVCVVCIVGAIALRHLETRHRHAAREAWDKVIHVYATVLKGVKQLQLDRSVARQTLLSFEQRVREQKHAIAGQSRYSDLLEIWIQAMFYLMLGVAVFGPFGDDSALRIGFGLLALLQIRRPLRSLIVDTKGFADASVALQRISGLGLTPHEDHPLPGSIQQSSAWSGGWRSLNLQGASFAYSGNSDAFNLGPLDLTFTPGEVIFIVGENGSGKTTLLKLLTGLYAPTTGTIRLDDVLVEEGNARWYRGKFAAVFADFCLFEGVVDLQSDDFDGQTERLMQWLRLSRRRLASTPDTYGKPLLSQGERGRVALLTALLQDRPIFVFDEWTADQDPRSKYFFYNEIVPELRDSGKLVIVVSNDQGYFDTADRVLCLQRGKPPEWRSPQSFRRQATPADDRSQAFMLE